MCSPRPSTRPARRRATGFTLIELMIGVVLGLLASLAVTHVLVNSEGQKRAATSGSDAQVNGALALNTLQRAIQPAGYGFAATPAVVGCSITANFSGAAVAGFPATLSPVFITDGGTGPDSIRVFASGKTSFSLPLRVTGSYTAGNIKFPVSTVRSIAAGDLIVAVKSGTTAMADACEMFRVTADPGSAPEVARSDDGGWNTAGRPAGAYGDGAVLINMGAPVDATYTITNNAMMVRSLSVASDALATPSYPAAVELFPNIVQMKAYYGKDSDGDGVIDTWDKVVPTNNADWLKVRAVRVAVVARSTQYEKDVVTPGNLSWDLGAGGTVTGASACGTSICATIKIDTLTDYQHYRYRVFDTVVPLRNMLWNS